MPTYPNEVYPSDATIEALGGTRDQPSDVKYVALGTSPQSSPSLIVQLHRELRKQLRALALVKAGMVVEDGSLTVGIFPINYRLGGTDKSYAGAENQAVVDDDTNYVYLNSSNALVINTTGFPADKTTFLPLAEVVAASGVLTITDQRDLIAWLVPQAAGSYAADDLSNLASVAINASLLMDTHNAYDVASATKALRSLYLATSLVLRGTNYNVTVGFTDPTVSAAALTIPDPAGVAQSIVLTTLAQTLANKTLTAPIIADLSNMTHDHGSAAKGDALVIGALGGNKWFPVTPSHYEAGTLSVAVLDWQWRAPVDLTLRSAAGRVVTAPTGDTLIVDVRVNGASIYGAQSQMIAIEAGAYEDVSDVKNHAVTAGQTISLEVQQIGSGTAGADLTVVLNCLAAPDSV